jgi:hypothetical protein
VTALFIERDGTWRQRELNGRPPVFRVPVRTPTRFSAYEATPEYTPVKCIEYRDCGSLLNGTPVYCAPGRDVREVVARRFVTRKERDIAGVDSANRRDAWELVDRDYRNAMKLDEWFGDWPTSDAALDAQHIVQRGYRLLVVVAS